MPEVSRFFGISVIFYYNDHVPPHFHATYEGEKAVFDIRTLQMTEGRISNRARGLVVEWAAQHHDELLAAWENARRGIPPGKIEPLH